MKKWKIYAGVVVVVAILSTCVSVGSEVSVSKASIEDMDTYTEASTNAQEVNNSVSTKVDSLETNEKILNEETLNDDLANEETLSSELSNEGTRNSDFTNEEVLNSEDANEEVIKEESVSDETKEVVDEGLVKAIVNADAKSKTDEAYKNVLEEEVYIAQLVSIKSGENYSRTDWKECLNYLRNNYRVLKLDSSVDMEKVDSYVFAYNTVESEEDMPLEVVNKNAPMTRAPYSPKKVTAYTDKYWKNYNPNYYNFDGKGGDCANFVSQAIYAGGKKMYGTKWDEYKYWFCRSNKDLTKISSSWRGAVGFGEYWKVNAKGYKTFDGSHFTSKEAQQPVYNYTNVGDAISFLLDSGRPYHTVVCSYKNRVYEDYPKGSKMIHFASHTGSHKWKSVYNYLKNSNTSIRVYDMY